jgi:membrane protein
VTHLFTSGGISLKEVAAHTWLEIREDDVFGRSAQLAYYFFLALFPFLICVIASLSVFGAADRGRTVLFEFFARFLPAPAFELISKTFGEILQSGGPLKMSLGIIACLWSASLGMSAAMNTLNAAYRVTETRSILKQYSVAIGLTLSIALLLVASIALAVFGSSIATSLSFRNLAGTAWRVVPWILALGVLLFGYAITYYFAPDLKTRRWHWITPGAILGVVVLILVSIGLRVYLHFFGNYSVAYGSLGAVIVLLLCFYLGGAALLSGGALNAVLDRLAAENPTRANKAVSSQIHGLQGRRSRRP